MEEDFCRSCHCPDKDSLVSIFQNNYEVIYAELTQLSVRCLGLSIVKSLCKTRRFDCRFPQTTCTPISFVRLALKSSNASNCSKKNV